MVEGRRHRHRGHDDGRRHPGHGDRPERVRPVHLGMGAVRRSRCRAELLHHGAGDDRSRGRRLQRRQLVQRRVRRAVRAAARRARPRQAPRDRAEDAGDLLRRGSVRGAVQVRRPAGHPLGPLGELRAPAGRRPVRCCSPTRRRPTSSWSPKGGGSTTAAARRIVGIGIASAVVAIAGGGLWFRSRRKGSDDERE